MQGSGWTEKVGLQADTPTNSWLETSNETYNGGRTSNFTIGSPAFSSDTSFGGMKEVRARLCGNSVTLTQRTDNPRTGNYAFNVNVASTVDGSGNGVNGDADLYIYGTPVNGYERRLGSIHLVLNNGVNNRILRRVSHLDPTYNPGNLDPTSCGSTTTDPTTGEVLTGLGSPAQPFKTARMAAFAAGLLGRPQMGVAPVLGAGIVLFKAGTTLEDLNTGLIGNGAICNQRAIRSQVDFAHEEADLQPRVLERGDDGRDRSCRRHRLHDVRPQRPH